MSSAGGSSKRSKSSKRSSRRNKNRQKNKSTSNRMNAQRGPFDIPNESFEHPWYEREVFSRFWQHYNILMRDTHASSAIQHAAYSDPLPTPAALGFPAARKRCSIHNRRRPSTLPNFIHQKIYPKLCHEHKAMQRKRKVEQLCGYSVDVDKLRAEGAERTELECATQSFSDQELTSQMRSGMQLGDTDESNDKFEQSKPEGGVSAEFLSFMEQSIRHREEWKNRKADVRKKQDGFILMDQDDDNGTLQEHPDRMRAREMGELYGAAAPGLHAMETAVQLTFDRVGTQHHTRLWPNIPINVMFGDNQ